MDLNEPKWQLPGLCPFCEQGSCLTLVACPKCELVAVICDEAGCFFPDPHNLTKDNPSSTFDENVQCPKCMVVDIRSFVPARSEQILKAGFKQGQYK